MTTTTEAITPFKNETILSFTDPADVSAMRAALASVKARLGAKYPVKIDGKAVQTVKHIPSINPANPAEVIGNVGAASKEQALEAIAVAARAFEDWKRVAPAQRASYLFKAADLIRERRYEWDAMLVYEVGRTSLRVGRDAGL